MAKHIYSTKKYFYLARELGLPGFDSLGGIERRTFPDGERYLRILDNPSGDHQILIGGTISEADTTEIYDLACALVKYGASRLSLIIPYFGYSTMERAVKSGEVVPAKTRARLLSSIPQSPEGNRIYLLDLHSEGLPHYFEGDVRTVHVYAKELIKKRAASMGAEVLGCTDAGRAKWVESLANDLNIQAAFVFKKRLSETETEITGISASVQDKHVVIYDDMIRTGGSLISAATAYKSAGAKKISALTTHGLFCGDSLNKILATNLFAEIACTNSHANTEALKENKKLEIDSIAPLLVEALTKDLK